MSAKQPSPGEQSALSRGGGANSIARQLGVILRQLDQERGRLRHSAFPCFLVIGVSGTGKTTLLRNADLRSLAASGTKAEPEPPLLECWLASDAAYVDTAGCLTSQETPLDRQSWAALLSAFQNVRGSHPLAGVVVVVSLAMIAEAGEQELEAEAQTIRQRLDEIKEKFAGARFHILFTKADLIAGFEPFMGGLGESERRQVWGADLPAPGLRQEGVGIGAESFDELLEHLHRLMPDRLHDLNDKDEQLAAFRFPHAFAQLKPRVIRFLRLVSGQTATANRLMSMHFAAVVPFSQRTRSPTAYFLHDLLAKHLPSKIPLPATVVGFGRAMRVATMSMAALTFIGIVGVLAISFAANRTLMADLDSILERNQAMLSRSLDGTEVTKADFENIVDALTLLASLRIEREEDDRWLVSRLVFNQRPAVEAVSTQAYRRALEQQFLPRLVLQAEQAVRANFTEPGRLHDPLKAYLQLGGEAPSVDREFVAAWFLRDWEDNLYPGRVNREGREELERHLSAMLDLDLPGKPPPPLDRPLVEAAQRSLASMPLAEFAWAQILSAGYSTGLEDHGLASQLGPSAQEVFETRDGRRIGTLRVSGFYTRAGFQQVLLPTLAELSQRLVEDQWLLGAGGERVGIERMTRQLGPVLLDRYSREFMAAWNGLLDNLRLRPLADDPPDYQVLRQLAAQNSPLRSLIEWVARETTLWRSVMPEGNGSRSFEVDSQMVEQLARMGVSLPLGKSQQRVTLASSSAIPGASIEAHFRPFHALVDDSTGRRPIDALIQNFEAIHRSLVIAAGAPAQAEFATSSLQLQLHNLRINASRLPRQLSRIVLAAADELDSDRPGGALEEVEAILSSSVVDLCAELVDGIYPFERDSDQDAQLGAFARLFSPGGELDRFFALNLAPLVDMTQPEWRWKPEATDRQLPQATLAAFQNAAKIRQAYFTHGGSNPSLEITLTPMSLHGDTDSVVLEVGDQEFHAYQAGNVPSKINWPSQHAAGAGLKLLPELAGRDNAVSFAGQWGMLRLFETAQFSQTDGALQMRFLIGGRDITYLVETIEDDPFAFKALAEFRCPDRL